MKIKPAVGTSPKFREIPFKLKMDFQAVFKKTFNKIPFFYTYKNVTIALIDKILSSEL